MTSHRMAVRRAVEVAENAMALAQALELRPAQSYAELFNNVNSHDVINALARTHSAVGEVAEAIAWAKQIGSDEKVPAKDTAHIGWAVQRRIHALLGVAEGMLDRSKK